MKNITRIIATLALLAPAYAAQAQPVHLECVTINAKGVFKNWSLSLDEQEGRVTYNTEISGTQRRPAVFLPHEVQFIGFTLDRRTLKLSRVVYSGMEEGKCRLVTVTDRAF